MSDSRKHLLEEALKEIPSRIASFDKLVSDFRERYPPHIYVQRMSDESGRGAAGMHIAACHELLNLICQCKSLVEEAIDDCFLRFLNACSYMELKPADYVNEITFEIRMNIVSFYSGLGVLIEDICEVDERPDRQRKSKVITGLIRSHGDTVLDERMTEAGQGKLRGKRIYRKQVRGSQFWQNIVIGLIVTIAGGIVVWWITRN